MENLQALETRRLMAVDLVASYEVQGGLPLITAFNTFGDVTFTVTNNGDTDATAPVVAELFFSTDRRFDANDMLAASAVFDNGVVAGRSVSNSTSFDLPADEGRYFLISVVDRAGVYRRVGGGMGETQRSNNSTVTRRPAVTLVPELTSSTVSGTDGADRIGVVFSGDQLVVGVNGDLFATDRATFQQLTINAGNGNDRVASNTDVTVPQVINGGSGTDRLGGGAGNDTVNGGADSDRIFGGAGDDSLTGEGGNDRLFGNAGLDRLFGNDGNDFFYTDGDSMIDSLVGGAGTDSGRYDPTDTRDSIEVQITA